MNHFYRYLPTLTGNFDFMGESGAGDYYVLWENMGKAGASLYYFERHLGVWLIIIAVLLLAIAWLFRSSTLQERIRLKERTAIVMVVIALFFGAAGIINEIIRLGFNY